MGRKMEVKPVKNPAVLVGIKQQNAEIQV